MFPPCTIIRCEKYDLEYLMSFKQCHIHNLRIERERRRKVLTNIESEKLKEYPSTLVNRNSESVNIINRKDELSCFKLIKSPNDIPRSPAAV